MDKLKPCPFCGGEARVFEEWGLTTTRSYVRCMKCFCNTGTYNSRKLVVEKWNRRASQEMAAILSPIPIANVKGLGFPIPCSGVEEHSNGPDVGAKATWVFRVLDVPAQTIKLLRAMGAEVDSGISLSVCGTGYKPYYVGDITGEYCSLIEMGAHDEPVICKTLGGNSYAED